MKNIAKTCIVLGLGCMLAGAAINVSQIINRGREVIK